MVGYNDSRQLPHTFGGRREHLWGLSLAGLQLWNSIRALDFLRDAALRPARRDRRDRRVGRRHADVPARRGRRAHRGRRAGQHDLAAHAGRLPVREPARPAARHHQRRDRRDDRAAAAADGVGDRRLDGRTRCEREYPAVRALYALFGAADRVHGRPVRRADTTTTTTAREAMYAWMARWLQGAPPTSSVPERSFTADAPARSAGLPSAAAARRRRHGGAADRPTGSPPPSASWRPRSPADFQSALAPRARPWRRIVGTAAIPPARRARSVLAGGRCGPRAALRRGRPDAAPHCLHPHSTRAGAAKVQPLRHLQPHAGGPARRRHRRRRCANHQARCCRRRRQRAGRPARGRRRAVSLAILAVGDFDPSPTTYISIGSTYQACGGPVA